MAQFDDGRPIYRQIAEQIKAQILSGALLEGEQVMSTNQYAAFYRINPATAAKAFAELVDEGILYKRRGIGMFVSDGAREALMVERRRLFASELLAPLVREARHLGMGIAELQTELASVYASLEKENDERSS